MRLTLSRAEHKLLVTALEEAIDYWSVTDLDGVRESRANQKRIAAGRILLGRIKPALVS